MEQPCQSLNRDLISIDTHNMGEPTIQSEDAVVNSEQGVTNAQLELLTGVSDLISVADDDEGLSVDQSAIEDSLQEV